MMPASFRLLRVSRLFAALLLTAGLGLDSWAGPLSGGDGGYSPQVTISAPTTAGCGSINCFAFTGLTGSSYVLKCHSIIGGNATQNLVVQFGTGGTPTWGTGSSDYTYNQLSNVGTTVAGGDGTAAGIPVFFEPLTTGTAGVTFEVIIQDLTSTTVNKTGLYSSGGTAVGPSRATYRGAGTYTANTTAVTAVRVIDIQATPVSIASGICTLEGVRI